MIRIKVDGQLIQVFYSTVAANAQQFVSFVATLSEEWDGYNITMRFQHADSNVIYDVTGVEDGVEYYIPHEVLVAGKVYVAALGVLGTDVIATSTRAPFPVQASGGTEAGATPVVTPDAYAQYLQSVEAVKVVTAADVVTATEQVKLATAQVALAATQVGLSQDQVVIATEQAVIAGNNVVAAAAQVVLAAEQTVAATASAVSAALSEVAAGEHAVAAGISEDGAEAAALVTHQAMTDYLALLGKDVPVMVGGKIAVENIPATAIQDIYEIASVDQLVTLVAQRGDLGEIVETVNNERTVTKTYQLLGDGDPTNIANWVVWGTSYAVQAGNASTATEAANANTINNHRVVTMTQAQYEGAALEADTIYLVG